MLPQKSGVGINSQSRDSTRSGETRMICWSIAIAPSCQRASQTSTAQAQSENLRVALDLTEEWDALQADSETPSTLVTGVVVARTAFAEEHPEVVSAFLDRYQESVDYVNSNVEEAAQMVGQYEIVTAEVAQKALPECNIVFIEGVEMKDSLSGYLSVLFEQNPKSVGGALPDDAFYYSR